MLFSVSLSLLLPVIAASSHHNKRHNELAHRLAAPEAPVIQWNQTGTLDKRGTCTGARATWYDVGLGACGKTNVPSDDIIALTHISFGSGYPGPNCFKTVSITCNGQTHSAQLMDECMGCPPCGIDMSTGLFQKFSDLGAGVLTCDWSFDDGSNAGGSSPPPPPPPKQAPPPPKPQPKPQPKPEEPKPSPKPAPTPTTHSTTHHSTPSSSHAASSSAAPAIQTPTGPQNIKNLFQAMIDMGQVVVDANN